MLRPLVLNRDELKELRQPHESRFFTVEISSLFANGDIVSDWCGCR